MIAVSRLLQIRIALMMLMGVLGLTDDHNKVFLTMSTLPGEADKIELRSEPRPSDAVLLSSDNFAPGSNPMLDRSPAALDELAQYLNSVAETCPTAGAIVLPTDPKHPIYVQR